jgi:Ca-activated chloride channel homolog
MGRRGVGRLGVAALIAFAAGLWASAQTDFKVDVRLVRLLATVKDANGRLVGGLNKEDFEVSDRGARQTIALFERQTAQPLSVAILLDASGSTGRELPYQVSSVVKFGRSLFGEGDPKDRASLYTFNWEVRQVTPFGRDPGLMEKRLRSVKSEAGTSLYDAIVLSSGDLAGLEGRKVMIIVTDGGDTISTKTFHESVEAAQRADAVVYAILVVPVKNDPGRNVGGENALEILTTQTGGRVLYPSELKRIDDAFGEILRDLRTQYLIGYYPSGVPASKERFHNVEVKTKSGLRVSTRSGYYE